MTMLMYLVLAEKFCYATEFRLLLVTASGGQSTQIKYLSKSTDTYNKILLQ